MPNEESEEASEENEEASEEIEEPQPESEHSSDPVNASNQSVTVTEYSNPISPLRIGSGESSEVRQQMEQLCTSEPKQLEESKSPAKEEQDSEEQ